jgi:beta-glucosidase-like glycosyl hydrolase
VGPELGLFDPIDSQPLARLTPEHTIATPETKALNLKAAQQSLVLLHNAEVLPLRRGQTIAVIGPHAQAQRSLIQVDTVAVCETNGDFSCLNCWVCRGAAYRQNGGCDRIRWRDSQLRWQSPWRNRREASYT